MHVRHDRVICITTPLLQLAAKQLYTLFVPWRKKIDDDIDYASIIETMASASGAAREEVPMRLRMMYFAAKAVEEERYIYNEPVSDGFPEDADHAVMAYMQEDIQLARESLNIQLLVGKLAAGAEE